MKRDTYIDSLRFLGLALIILAHIRPPVPIAQIRCFDVPLMLFVSGLTASKHIEENYYSYIVRRTKRLVFPVWIFLSVYLSFLYIVQFRIWPVQYLTGKMIVRSFLLLDNSIGYVWIIRIFLILMLVTPFLQKLNAIIKNNIHFSALLVFAIMILECIHHLGDLSKENVFMSFFIVDILQYGLAYSIPFILGIRCRDLNKDNSLYILFFMIISLLLSIICYYFIYGLPIILTPTFKKPPHSYFLIYGCFVSVVLWHYKTYVQKLVSNKVFVFLGQNTIWIYLFHMPFVLISGSISSVWFIRYIFVFGFAVLLFLIQRYIVLKIDNDLSKKYFLG